MAVTLPSANPNLATVYAASMISVMESDSTDANGHLVPVASGQVNYGRKDYLLDDNGNRVGTIQRAVSASVPGYLPIPAKDIAAFLATRPQASIYEALVEMADSYITKDLIKLGILPDPAV